MDKFMIALGIALLAGLSFAVDEVDGGPDNWMQVVEWRYGCMFDYNWELFDMVIPGGCVIGGEDDWGELDSYMDCYLERETCMEYALEDMYYAAECESDGGANPTAFRSAMLSFNMNNFLFKQKFVSLIRGCLAGTVKCECTREHMIEDLGYATISYRQCLNNEEPWCWDPEPPEP